MQPILFSGSTACPICTAFALARNMLWLTSALTALVLLAFGKEHACLMVWLALVHGLVDLIEGHPVPDLSFVTPEHRFTVPGKEIDQARLRQEP